jgi:ribosome-associated toxin RatA of RatAB toxin-antitoxin module
MSMLKELYTPREDEPKDPSDGALELLGDFRRWAGFCDFVAHIEHRAHTVTGSVLDLWWLDRDQNIRKSVVDLEFDRTANSARISLSTMENAGTPRRTAEGRQIIEATVEPCLGLRSLRLSSLSTAELDRLKAEILVALDRARFYQKLNPILTILTSCQVSASCGPAAAYQVIRDVESWPSYLPHVQRVVNSKSAKMTQSFTMESAGMDGKSHTVELVRICFAPHKISFKQIRPPGMFLSRTGEWNCVPNNSGGTDISLSSTSILKPGTFASFLRPGDFETARARVANHLTSRCQELLHALKHRAETA